MADPAEPTGPVEAQPATSDGRPEPELQAAAAIRSALAGRAPHGASVPEAQVSILASWAVQVMAALRAGGTLYTFGNGGSASDAEHLAAELVGRYHHDRRPLAAQALTTNTAALTAIANDYGFEEVFARQVHALAGPRDVVLAITTSGRSPNVLAALVAARHVGARRLALVGASAAGTAIGDLADSVLEVAPDHTPGVQEAHRLAWHLLCVGIDAVLDVPLHPTPSGACSLDEAMERVAGWRAAGHRIATTNGCFDVLHEGHVAALGEARRQADHLIVLCNSDASVARSKGASRPVVPFDQRVAVLAALRSVDLVVELDEDLPITLLERLRPDVHVKGREYSIDELPEAAVVLAGGGRIHFSAMLPERSTTSFLDGIGPRS